MFNAIIALYEVVTQSTIPNRIEISKCFTSMHALTTVPWKENIRKTRVMTYQINVITYISLSRAGGILPISI